MYSFAVHRCYPLETYGDATARGRRRRAFLPAHAAKVLLPVIVYILNCASYTVHASFGADLTIEDVIDNVRRSENLYTDLDVTLHYQYSVESRDNGRPANSDSAAMVEITSVEAKDHYVTQQGLFRLDRAASGTVGGRGQCFNRIRSYDGQATRVLDQNAVGNIVRGCAEDESAVRPHMLLMSSSIYAPLSVYLSGHNAMAAHPMGGKRWRNRLTVVASVEGAGDRQGLSCYRVWITTFGADKSLPYDRWELWLAANRNYIPVEMTAWTFAYSNELPAGRGQVNDLREIAPGVWFPFDVQSECYHPALLQQGRKEVRWRRRHRVVSASLEPHYDRAYFSNVTFPKGTAVYEVENRKITNSYRVGAPNGPSVRGFRWWLVAVNAVVVGLGVIGLIRKRRKGVAGVR